MTVKLSKQAEDIVLAQLKTGRYSTPEEVVNRMVEDKFLPGAAAHPPAPNEKELVASLIKAVNAPTHPYRPGQFVELAQRVIAEERSA